VYWFVEPRRRRRRRRRRRIEILSFNLISSK
jgi:hypothetical protein